MKCLRKNIALARMLLALFMVPLFAPVGIAAITPANSHHERHSDGIVICTTTGLKLLTPSGEIVPIGEHDKSLSSEHCEACFLSGFAGNTDRENIGLVAVTRTIVRKKRPLSFRPAFALWTQSFLGARAPPV